MHIKYVCKMIKKVCNSIHKMHNTFFKFGWFLFQVNLSVDLYSTTTTPALFGSLETFCNFSHHVKDHHWCRELGHHVWARGQITVFCGRAQRQHQVSRILVIFCNIHRAIQRVCVRENLAQTTWIVTWDLMSL